MSGRISHYAACLLLVQLTVACSQQNDVDQVVRQESANDMGSSAVVSKVEDKSLIVAFGDSLYAGYGLSQSEGFAPVLERELGKQGLQAEVVNAGVSGDTTAGGRQRLAFVLDGLARKPDLVIVGLGANDMLRGLDPDQARDNLDAMLAMLKERKIDAALTGTLASANLGPDYAAKFNVIYPALSKKYQVPLYPFFLDGVAGRPDRALPDGLHPNAAGVAEIVRRILPTIQDAAKA